MLDEKKEVAQTGHVEGGTHNDVAEASDAEHSMGILQAFKAYPKAVAWSMVFSAAIIMEGFDLTMINSFYALPAFQRKYGDARGDGTYFISAEWQAGLSNGVQVGSIAGLFLNGFLCDRIGYVHTITLALVMITCFIFITFFAPNIVVLLVGEILCGIPWGILQSLTTAYAAEVCPIPLRPYLTTFVNLCWVIGQFISSGVLKAMSTYSETDQWAYRIPFALQWIWPLPILVASLLAPESPWYLVRMGKLDQAKKSLQRLTSTRPGAIPIDIDQRVSQMVYTNELEKSANKGTSYIDLFKGTNRRRTEITSMVWAIQTLAGSGFIGYSTNFYRQAGLSVDDAFSLSLGQYALGAVGTISSWYTINKFGRRPLYLWGCVSMFVVLLGVGFTGLKDNEAASWAAGSLIFFYSFLYQFTVGPVCYCLVAELPSTRLRAKTVAFARIVYNIGSVLLFGIFVTSETLTVGIVNNILFPRMLEPEAWGWSKKAGFFWAGSNLLCIAYIYWRLPEPKGRTYAELDVLFEDGVSARNFAKTNVDLFAHARAHGREYKEDKNVVAAPMGH